MGAAGEAVMDAERGASGASGTMSQTRVFSGARPTGRQHIGNYLGAIQNYVALQDIATCFYCIVDYHAMTTLEQTERIARNTRDMVLDWLAAGIDPNRAVIFAQSDVPQVSEVALLLSNIVPLYWMMSYPMYRDHDLAHAEVRDYHLLRLPYQMD